MNVHIKSSDSNHAPVKVLVPQPDGQSAVLTFDNMPEMIGIPFIFMTPKANTINFPSGINIYKNQQLKKAFATNPDGVTFFSDLAKFQSNANLFEDKRLIKTILKRNTVYMEGETPNFLYFILSGKVKVLKTNECGKECVYDIYQEGDFLGYAALMEDCVYKESATAIENTEVAIIPRTVFLQLLHSNSRTTMQFIKLIAKKFSDVEDKMVKIAYNSARKRVADAILYMSKKYQNSPFFTFEREILSAIAGLAGESVSRILTDFREEGLIAIQKGQVKILNPKKLETLKN